ncbi:MAG TPA: uridine kinase [Methylomirabilota bacterium]|nr:uridine kinase [Methylomirabilota bacterium]
MESKQTTRKPKLVAIVGGSCSGKTWLATRLEEKLGHIASRLSQDDFYHDRSHLPPGRRAKLNFDHPRAIDWQALEEVALGCEVGREAAVPHYDFATHARAAKPRAWTPKQVVIMEGLWLLHRKALRKAFDFALFLDCSKEVSKERRLKRDQSERNRTPESIQEQLESTVFPMQDRFVAPQARWAHMVLPQPPGDAEVEQIANKIKQLVSF